MTQKLKHILLTLTLTLTLSLSLSPLFSQFLPVHPTHTIYPFLTELANEGIIDITTAAIPFSEKEIAGWLKEIDASTLNDRQQAELSFFKKEFNTIALENPQAIRNGFFRRGPSQPLDAFHYSDSLFTIRVNPILGGNYFINQDGSAWHWWNGAEARATAGKWAFYGSLRDNHESEYLTQPDFLNQNYGGANFKRLDGGQIDYWEYRGGVSYDFGMGNIGIYKDHFSWGSNYNGANILSGRTHSFAHIAFNIQPVDWFEFRYVHGWLVSEVVDSTRSFNVTNAYGNDYREVYHSKFMAANFFTFKPLKKLHFSLGNSIIYDYDYPHAAYFIPVIFYKAVDHHLSSGNDNMNSQLFFDLSTRFIPKTHLYATLFIDELAVKRITNPDEYNFVSFKGGLRSDNLLPNLYFGGEYTVSNALTYQHYVNTTTFESNRFNLGHYLKDNARELHLYAGYKPFRGVNLQIAYTHAEKGPDHTLLGTEPRTTIKPLDPIEWEASTLGLQANWQIIHNTHLRLIYTHRNITGTEEALTRYTPTFRHGKTNELTLGLNFGF